jgi:hypothetical protein
MALAEIRERLRVLMAGSGIIRAMHMRLHPASGPVTARLSAPAGAPGGILGRGIPGTIDHFML